MSVSREKALPETGTLKLGELLEEFDERLGSRPEPEILTLTEKIGFVAQRERFKKRLAIADTSDYKVIGLYDIALNPYLLWAGAIAQNTGWETAIISPLYPTFRVRKGYSARFVNHLLCGGFLRPRYGAISYGSVPRKRRATVKDFLALQIHMPVPPLAEQERIVKLLDEADELRKLRAQADHRTADLIPALFHEMFGDMGLKSGRWPTERLGRLATIEATLVDPRVEAYQDLPHIGSDRIERDSGNLLASKSAREDGLISAKFLFDERDVLYSKIRPNLRKAALPIGRGLCSADIYPIRPGPKLLREFLWAYLLTDHFTDRAVDLSARANMPKLNRVQLDSIESPVPPLPLQKEFAARVSDIRAMQAEQAASRRRLENLFQSMLHRAFKGEL